MEPWRKELQCLPQAFAGAVAPTAFASRHVSVVLRSLRSGHARGTARPRFGCRTPGAGRAAGCQASASQAVPIRPRHRITASGFRRFDDVATQGESGESAPLMPGI